MTNPDALYHDFERKPSADDPRYGADCAAGIVREVLSDLGRKWALPAEDFGRVIALDVARALEESPVLLARLSAAIGTHLWRCFRGAKLLEELAAAGITVRLDGPLLKARGKLTRETAERIRAGRRDLVAALKEAG
jgi:hypothetical protein